MERLARTLCMARTGGRDGKGAHSCSTMDRTAHARDRRASARRTTTRPPSSTRCGVPASWRAAAASRITHGARRRGLRAVDAGGATRPSRASIPLPRSTSSPGVTCESRLRVRAALRARGARPAVGRRRALGRRAHARRAARGAGADEATVQIGAPRPAPARGRRARRDRPRRSRARRGCADGRGRDAADAARAARELRRQVSGSTPAYANARAHHAAFGSANGRTSAQSSPISAARTGRDG